MEWDPGLVVPPWKIWTWMERSLVRPSWSGGCSWGPFVETPRYGGLAVIVDCVSVTAEEGKGSGGSQQEIYPLMTSMTEVPVRGDQGESYPLVGRHSVSVFGSL